VERLLRVWMEPWRRTLAACLQSAMLACGQKTTCTPADGDQVNLTPIHSTFAVSRVLHDFETRAAAQPLRVRAHPSSRPCSPSSPCKVSSISWLPADGGELRPCWCKGRRRRHTQRLYPARSCQDPPLARRCCPPPTLSSAPVCQGHHNTMRHPADRQSPHHPLTQCLF
jgi:hypothetical protein